MVTASLNNYRQSPRKVRLVADFVRGKRVPQALTTLSFLSKRAASPVKTVIESALSNAKDKVDVSTLIVKEIRVDEGVTLKRFMPRARGSAFRINKRTSHIQVVLAPAPERPSKKRARPEAAK